MSETQELTSTITQIHPNRTSSSGTPYCAIELEAYPGEWFFIWSGVFKDDIENNQSLYRDEEVHVIYKDKEEEPDEHFFNINQIWPSSRKTCEKLIQRKRMEDSVKG